MELLRKIFNRQPKESPKESPYAGQNAIEEHAFFEAGSLLHGGEDSNKKVEMTAGEINARFEAQAEKERKQGVLADIKKQRTEAKMARSRDIHAQKIEAAKLNIEQAALKPLPGAIKTVAIEHSPLQLKPKLTVLAGGASETKKPVTETEWHIDDTANELTSSNAESLDEHAFLGAPKKNETISRIIVAEFKRPTKPTMSSESPATEERRAA